MKLRTRNKLIKLVSSEEFQSFILTEGEPLLTDEVVDWLRSLHTDIPNVLKKEAKEIERIGGECGCIIELGLWIDIQIASVEARTKPNSNDKRLCREILETNIKKASQRRQMEWNF